MKKVATKETSETDILKKTLVDLCKKYAGRGLFYRRNTGAIELQHGFVRFGLPGMADIGGMVQDPWMAYAVPVEIEVKSDTGKQSDAQKNWQRAVERAGGIYILTRSAKDCLEQVALHLDSLRLNGALAAPPDTE